MTIDPLLGKTVKQAVTSPAIRQELDAFLRRKTWQEPTSLAWNMWLGIALLVASLGLMALLAGTLSIVAFLLCLGVAVLLGATSLYGQHALAILTRSGLWDQTILQTTVALVDDVYVYAEKKRSDHEYLGRAANLLALLAAAPTYISEAERFAYWCDTLDELRHHATVSRALISVRDRRRAAEQRLDAVQRDSPPVKPTKRWGILPTPGAPEDPLVQVARRQLGEVQAEEQTLTAYLDRIVANVATRRRELGRALAATELYLDVPTEHLLLPALPPVESLPYADALRDLVK